jgi:alpha-amylase/alpha-mannosidase (GH57 family)
MSEIYVSLLLHFYQPPWQFRDVLERICDECYRPFIDYFRKYKPPITLNMNYSLLEVLRRDKLEDVVEGFKNVGNQVDVTNSAAYHIIIPLILALQNGEHIVRDQIKLNKKGLEDLGITPRGFFPPEMAIDENSLAFIDGVWAIADSVCYDAVNSDTIPYNYVGLVKDKPIIFRSRNWSNELTLAMPSRNDYDIKGYVSRLKEGLEKWFKGDGYVVLAFDGETLGHHVKQYRNFLEQFFNILADSKIEAKTISDIMNIFQERREVRIAPGSWSTEIEQIKKGIYYPLWYGDNEIHRIWYQTISTLAEIYTSLDDEGKNFVNRELNSCIPWQASFGKTKFFYDWLNKVVSFIERINESSYLELEKL